VIARRGLRAAVLGSGLALIASVVVACANSGPLHVENASDIAVAVYADGRWVGTYGPGASGDASITAAGRPQTLEVRSALGAVLLSLPINDDQLAAGAAGTYGNGASIDLPCGEVSLLIGTLAPGQKLIPPMRVAPGPCT
jgi:hypothetical protein